MLRNSLLLLFAALLFAGACTKKPSNVIPEKVTDTIYVDTTKMDTSNVDTTYVVKGIADMHVSTVGKDVFSFEIVRNSGEHRKITLSMTGLPDKVKAKWTNESGYADFISMVELDVMFLPPGKYPVKLMTTAEGHKTKVFEFNLVVDTLTDKEAVSLLTFALKVPTTQFNSSMFDSSFYYTSFGMYTHPGNGMAYLRSLPLYTDSVAANGYVTLRNVVNDLYATNAHVNIILDADSGKIIIPEQEVVGRKVPPAPATPVNFIIYGEGMVDAKTKTYSITYYTQPVIAGTPVPASFSVKGDFIY